MSHHKKFRSCVGRRSTESCEMLLHCLQSLGETKVSEKNMILVGEEDVLCLDVPVDHALLVHVVDTCQLHG